MQQAIRRLNCLQIILLIPFFERHPEEFLGILFYSNKYKDPFDSCTVGALFKNNNNRVVHQELEFLHFFDRKKPCWKYYSRFFEKFTNDKFKFYNLDLKEDFVADVLCTDTQSQQLKKIPGACLDLKRPF